MRCLLCGEELNAYKLAENTTSGYYCSDNSCPMSRTVLLEETAVALEKLAHDVATQYLIADRYQEWAKAHIAELYKERDEARKLAYKYYKELEQEQKDWEDASDFDALAFENKLNAKDDIDEN